MPTLRSLACGIAASLAAAIPLRAAAAPSLSICMSTEGETGEHTQCPDPGLDAVSLFYNSTWQPFGPEIAIVHDAVSAAWSVLAADASVYARYGAQVSTGFTNDYNYDAAHLDADDFTITGPPGPVTFTLNVFVNGAVHASTNDAQRFPATAGVNITGTIFKKLDPPIYQSDTCPMTIGGGNANANGQSGYGVYAAHIGGPALFTSDPCTVNANTPFRVRLDLNVGASLVTPFAYDLPGPGAEGSASTHFSASFPSSGPVFNLPVGYTAGSVTAQVSDNGYLPEPDPPALAAAALLALAGSARARRRASRCTKA